MTIRSAARRPLPMLVALVALVAVACGSAAPAQESPPSAAPVATLAGQTQRPISNPAPATPRPSVRPSPVPSAPAPTPVPSTLAALPRHGRIAIPASGFAVTLPANWYRIDLTQQDLQAFFQAGSKAMDPSQSAQLSSQIAQLAATHIPLFALRFPDAKASAGTNLNVAALPSLGLDLDTLEKLNVSQLGAALGPSVKIGHSRVRLPAGPAVRFAYTITAPSMPGGKAALLQFLLVGKSTQFVLSCTAPGTMAKVAPECEKMAKSLEILH